MYTVYQCMQSMYWGTMLVWRNGLVLGTLDFQSLGQGLVFQTEVLSFHFFLLSMYIYDIQVHV